MTGKGGGRRPSGPAAARRRALLVFGVAFLALFVIVAIAEGIGSPSVPSGDVALVEGVPSEVGEVSQARFEHALLLAAKQAGERSAPKPSDPRYDELKRTALDGTFERIWLQGQAEEAGIEVSDAEVARELERLKRESFRSEAEFKKVIEEGGFTEADVDEQVKLRIYSTKLQEQLREAAPQPSKSEVESYYEAAKATQFTTPGSRDVRVVVNRDLKKAEAAKSALEKDDSARSWETVAKQYSEDAATKDSGGLKSGVQEGAEEEPLDAAFFGASEGQVEGPVKGRSGYVVFEVESVTPESAQDLRTVESQIEAALAQRSEQEYIAAFVEDFSTKWMQRTHCASDYVTERCASYEGTGHPAMAPPACYEANPRGGLPEACPAPVFQLVPALPGTVTPLEPRGKPLAQRPHPAGEAREEAAAGLESLPEGVTPPPTGE